MIHGYRGTTENRQRHFESVVSFGVRHLPATHLHAKIRKASLFNRALKNTEVKALLNPYSYVSENEIIDHLSPKMKTNLRIFHQSKQISFEKYRDSKILQPMIKRNYKP